ncbi:MAG: hypothetical protein U0491_00850 [Candidatus Saccharimonadales bacterium]
MSNVFIALLLALGASAWIYSKLMRTTGNNTRSAVTAAVISGVLIFFVGWIVIGFIAGLSK